MPIVFTNPFEFTLLTFVVNLLSALFPTLNPVADVNNVIAVLSLASDVKFTGVDTTLLLPAVTHLHPSLVPKHSG